MSKILLETDIVVDNYTEYVCDKYDLQTRSHITTEIPMIDEEDLSTFTWNIGLICGNSGSGKSTVLNKLGNPSVPAYDYSKSIISQFPNMTESDVCDLLSSVGLSSVPVWMHKPNELSNGEKARLDICWIIANAKENDIILIDEFSSVINRDCAKSLSFALQRYVRKYNLKIILASCHFDIIEWLNPDWIFNLNKQNENGECDLERLLYSDNEEYDTYKMMNPNAILSDEYKINL